MKKLSFISLMILFLASCEEVGLLNPESEAITFRVSSASSTKGEDVTIKNLNEFKVNAIAGSATYFSGLAVRSGNQGTTWVPEKIYFWPDSDVLFYAWSRENGTVIIDVDKCRIEDFHVPGNVDDQNDLVVAGAFNKAQGRQGKEVVDLPFRHATASVRVMATNGNTEAYSIKVYGVKYGNLRDTDTVTIPSDGRALTGSEWSSWSDRAYSENTSADYKVIYSQPVELDGNPVTVSGSKSLFLIPQCRDKWKAVSAETNTPENRGAYLSLLVCVTTVDGVPIYPSSASYKVDGINAAWTAVGVDMELYPGYVSTYTLNFFKDGGIGQQDPEEPEDETKGGDHILDGSINVSVSVEEWIDGNGTDIDIEY